MRYPIIIEYGPTGAPYRLVAAILEGIDALCCILSLGYIKTGLVVRFFDSKYEETLWNSTYLGLWNRKSTKVP